MVIPLLFGQMSVLPPFHWPGHSYPCCPVYLRKSPCLSKAFLSMLLVNNSQLHIHQSGGKYSMLFSDNEGNNCMFYFIPQKWIASRTKLPYFLQIGKSARSKAESHFRFYSAVHLCCCSLILVLVEFLSSIVFLLFQVIRQTGRKIKTGPKPNLNHNKQIEYE